MTQEFAWIERYLAPLATTKGALGLTDDGALLDERWVVVTDSMEEHVHFFAGDAPCDVARQLLRVNIADCAAMGADPAFYLLNLGLRPQDAQAWMEGIARGLAQDQKEFGVSLLGGDTYGTADAMSLTLTLFGKRRHGDCVMRRGGMQAGDVIGVTGFLGDAACGVWHKKNNRKLSDAGYFAKRRLLPQPPVAFGKELGGFAHAALDVSDGLVADVGHLARLSALGVTIDADALPLSEPLRRSVARADALGFALYGGGDYELLFAVAPADWEKARTLGVERKTKVTKIAHAHKAKEGAQILLNADGIVQPADTTRLFEHFTAAH